VFGTTAAIFSLLLIATGAMKVVSPHDTERAIRAMGLPGPAGVGRLLGLVEIGIGATALLLGLAMVWFSQALLFAAFFGWVVAAMSRSTPIASCGCLGTPDTPPYWGHLIVNGLAIVCSIAAGVGAEKWLVGTGWGIIAGATVVAVGAFLAWVVIGDGARLHGAVHQ
jgi:hypothetical protein